MNRCVCPHAWAGTFVMVAVLAGCGGGGGGDAPPPPPAPNAVTISGVAADGPLQGATACYDLNDNAACDSGEPSGTTDADGKFSFEVNAAASGQHRIVVNVPATAIDKDTGQPVGAAFTLQSPATGTAAAHSVFVSPLTTLVQAQVDTTGATVAQASDFVQAQAALGISPLADFVATSSPEAQHAAMVARLVQAATNKQSEEVAGAVGQVDLSGATMTQADIDRAVVKAVIGILPALGGAAAEPAIVNASPEARQAAVQAAAQAIVAEQSGLTADKVATVVGIGKLPPEEVAAAPAAGASLRGFSYTDANHWFYRALQSSVADSTPDADGWTRFYDVRSQSAANMFGDPVVTSWSRGATKERETDIHWNGTAWVSCPFGYRNLSTPRDANGRNQYNYCNGFEEGVSTRSSKDISGQTLRSVVEAIRTFPGSETGVAYANWGPANLDLLGPATFPPGSRLAYQSSQALKTAPAYDIRDSAAVRVFTAAVAAGGDARNASPACGAVTPANAGTFRTRATTLEELVARNPGTPCIFAQHLAGADTSLDPNEWWGNSTASLGVIPNAMAKPAGTSNYYTGNAALMVAFAASGNATTYYSCHQRRSDNSQRNCSVIGTGTYAIQTLGDGRTMTFTGLPAITQRAGFTRVFIERGGKVYFGYQTPAGRSTEIAQLNLTAANALFAQLGLQPIKPIPPASAADAAKQQLFANAKGAWGESTADSALVIRFGDNGQFFLAQADVPLANEADGVELGLLDIDPATGVYTGLLEVDSNWQAGVSHPQAEARITSISATELKTQSETFNRLSNDPNGIVGLWALDSSTDLKAVHLAFFANGRVMLIHPRPESDTTSACFRDNQGPPGVEYASYTFDAASGALRVFNKTHDSTGCTGMFDTGPNGTSSNTELNFTLVFAADKMSADVTVVEDAEQLVIHRIAPQ